MDVQQKLFKEICLPTCKAQKSCISCVDKFKSLDTKTPCQAYGKMYKQSIWDKEE